MSLICTLTSFLFPYFTYYLYTITNKPSNPLVTGKIVLLGYYLSRSLLISKRICINRLSAALWWTVTATASSRQSWGGDSVRAANMAGWRTVRPLTCTSGPSCCCSHAGPTGPTGPTGPPPSNQWNTSAHLEALSHSVSVGNHPLIISRFERNVFTEH